MYVLTGLDVHQRIDAVFEKRLSGRLALAGRLILPYSLSFDEQHHTAFMQRTIGDQINTKCTQPALQRDNPNPHPYHYQCHSLGTDRSSTNTTFCRRTLGFFRNLERLASTGYGEFTCASHNVYTPPVATVSKIAKTHYYGTLVQPSWYAASEKLQTFISVGTALYMAERGHKVSIVTSSPIVGREIVRTSADIALRERLRQHGTNFYCESAIQQWQGNRATIVDLLDNSEQLKELDSLVLSTTNTPVDDLEQELTERTDINFVFFAIGDYLAPRQTPAAIYECSKTAMNL